MLDRASAVYRLAKTNGQSWISAHYDTSNRINMVMPESNVNYWGPLFTPEEAYQIDTKYDDGVPDAGEIYTHAAWDGAAWTTDCVTSVGAPGSNSAQYVLPMGKELSCAMSFFITK